MTEEFKFELLENGLDFILSGLNYVSRQDSKSDLKYGILHICSGIELIIKERLKREHWSLIFHNIENANEELLISCEFKSVDLRNCLQRLKNICNISINENDEKHLIDFRNKRNKLEHFGINDSWEGILSSSARVVSIILDFISNELEPEYFDPIEEEHFKELREKISYFDELVELRMDSLKEDLESAEKDGLFTTECPICYQDTLILGDSQTSCLFCNYKAEPEDAARLWISTHMKINEYMIVKDGGDYPLYLCPECDNNTLVDSEKYICFACGNHWDISTLDNCLDCNRLYILRDDEPPFCYDCIEYKSTKD